MDLFFKNRFQNFQKHQPVEPFFAVFTPNYSEKIVDNVKFDFFSQKILQ